MMTTQLVERSLTTWELDSDGRTIVGLCVPYDVPTLVADPPPADPTPYMETWRRGVFRAQLRDPARVPLLWNHDATGMALGRTVALDDTERGLQGTFRVVDSPRGEDAIAQIREGLARGLSIHAAVAPLGSRGSVLREGVVERTQATLRHVALCVQPAYSDAQVMAIRSRQAHASALAEVRATQARLRATVRPERAS